MSAAVFDVITRFNALSPEEREEVSATIFPEHDDGGDLTDEDYTALADELFQQYDREEAEHADSAS